MPGTAAEEKIQELLAGHHIAALATHNEDGSIHMAAVWYVFEEGCLYVATASQSRKARNVAARPRASLMVDIRKVGAERGVTASGKAELISGAPAREIGEHIHRRYLGAAALADPRVGPVFAGLNDVAIRLHPAKWTWWDMSALDAAVFGGRVFGTPGYLLPLD